MDSSNTSSCHGLLNTPYTSAQAVPDVTNCFGFMFTLKWPFSCYFEQCKVVILVQDFSECSISCYSFQVLSPTLHGIIVAGPSAASLPAPLVAGPPAAATSLPASLMADPSVASPPVSWPYIYSPTSCCFLFWLP